MITQSDFTTIVNDTKSYVLGAILKTLPEEYSHAIDDIVQETYIRAFNSLSKNKFRYDSKLSTWLFTIARNETLRMIDKLNREEKKKRKFKENNEKKFSKSFENNIIKENKEIYYNYIEKLPDFQKQIVNLYLEGYKLKDISKMMALPIGTVKSRLNRSKELLKNMLKEDDSE